MDGPQATGATPDPESMPAGTALEILTDENPKLRLVSDPAQLDDPTLQQNVADLAETLRDFRDRAGFGRAISAPQVGIMKRLIVMNLGEGPVALLNPVIVDRSSQMQTVWDDCLSVPDRMVQLERHESISLRYQDLEGGCVDWNHLAPDLAELLQHECDHLDGILMTDRAASPEAIRPLAEHPRLADQ